MIAFKEYAPAYPRIDGRFTVQKPSQRAAPQQHGRFLVTAFLKITKQAVFQ